ncbi:MULTISPECIES: hypothetical protein [unclassified Streptomyces]|uniref:hypothetical protein n=1 Tax=unclassified Streptomyces TaxID=2593676 RepID=UPI00225972BF|nr:MULTISPECIES: hypothetical protein [unclassified Streptomyces]WSP59305.1 hypothetical protein OG306_36695 [Streptomyces sp. NBC_01241]WSU20175.1 hypothetical protein OG508_03665 [Streptomyces sp. NBC_01108]MCX4791059.1 hypothetical protein [Streptomyces sp. NBC_01221]MCX4793216.1 hypothetical protein [Streptomyces sp. NBC_01242]WSJ34661.1 hypothetical protein OG772_00330 [Streptomyces sp. NBC_01321]
MHPERQDGTSGGGLLVPMAWMYAEYIADELLRTGDLMEPSTLEYRAGRDALALTIFLSDDGADAALHAARLDELRLLTAYGAAWAGWVRDRLHAPDAVPEPVPGAADPDLALARAAWRWLEETELLAADLDALGPPPREPAGDGADAEEAAQVWTPAWQLGLPLGHLAVHLH